MGDVGIVGGTGPLGRGLAARLAAGGTPIIVGSREPERAVEVVASLHAAWPQHRLQITGAGNADAAGAEVVFMATPWDSLISTGVGLCEALAGKVVVSVANALVRDGRGFAGLVPARGSMAAALQAALPASKVAAAAQHLPAGTLADLDAELRADVLVCSDHAEATAVTSELLSGIAGLRPLDAGSLAAAGAIESFTAVLVTLNVRYKGHSTLLLGGLDKAPGGESRL